MQLPQNLRCLAFLLVLLIVLPPAAHATELGDKINRGTVGIVTGDLDGTYAQIASDLARVLDDGEKLRILPILGKGSIQNIADILYLKGVDIGIVQSDVFAFMKREGMFPAIDRRVHYITKLYNEEFHLLAHESIESVAALEGRKVSFGKQGRFYMTGSVIFGDLGLRVEPVALDEALALERIKSGEIAALVYVSGKPTKFFRKIPSNAPVRLLAIPFSPKLMATYLPTSLTAEDYPNLLDQGESVETLAVGAVMAAFNWAPDTDRYAKVSRFVDAFFSNFGAFQKAPRHRKWKDVNLTAEVPGWTRFRAADEWLANQ